MTPQQYCEDKAKQSGSSFYASFRYLPPEQRDAMVALYAFCREVDDVVDEIHDDNVARTTLAWWRTELAALYDGTPSHPVMLALKPHVARFELPQAWLAEIIDGMQMDLDVPRYNRFADLQLYCHRVAGVVGQLSAQIFGYSDRATLKYAHELGLAFQLTNIIRDVGEDALRGRIYLPISELQQFDVKAHEILKRNHSERFASLMAFQARRAHALYDEALALLPAADRRSQKPGLMMASIYRTLLREIEQDGFRVLHQRIALTPLRKLWLAWRVQALGKL